MKHHLWIIALVLLPLGLSAQTKPIVHKPVRSTSKPTVAQAAHATETAPVKKATLEAATPNQPAMVAPAPVAVQAQSSQPASVNHTQPTATVDRPAIPATSKTGHLQVGVRAGGNLSTIGGLAGSADGGVLQLSRIVGFHGGLVFNIGGPTFSVQPEVLLSQYGIRLNLGSDYIQTKYNLIEVPVLLKVSFGRPDLRFFVNAGPVATYAMSGTVSYREDGQINSDAINMGKQGRLSYGGAGGAGLAIKAGPGNVLLEGRYTYLLTNQEDGVRSTPQNAMLSVGYLIQLGGR